MPTAHSRRVIVENTLYFLGALVVVVVVLAMALTWRCEVNIGQVKLGKVSIKDVKITRRKDNTN